MDGTYFPKNTLTKSLALCSLSPASAGSSPGISTRSRRTKESIPLLTRWLREDIFALLRLKYELEFRGRLKFMLIRYPFQETRSVLWTREAKPG
jgi:hypothetical protein